MSERKSAPSLGDRPLKDPLADSRNVQIISFLVGYLQQDIKLAVFVALGGTALTFLIVVPPWPFYNKNPVNWLPVRGAPPVSVPQNLVIDEKAIQ